MICTFSNKCSPRILSYVFLLNKKKRDSHVIWNKPLYQRNNQQEQSNNTKTSPTNSIICNNYYGPTEEGQLGRLRSLKRNFFPWFKHKSYWQWCSYQRFDKRDYFWFPFVNFLWLSGDVPMLPSYCVYISQLVRFARCCTSFSDFNSKNLQITSKLLTHGYRYHKLRKTFGKFFRSYSDHLR